MFYYLKSHRWAALAGTLFVVILTSIMMTCSLAYAQKQSTPACSPDNGGLTLPPGFCATIFADNIGHARHLTVAPNGVVYVNTWSSKYYKGQPQLPGSMVLALQDTTGDGRADIVKRFGDTLEQGNNGGTGIVFYKGALYAEMNDRIVRYTIPKNSIVPTAPPEVIVSGLPLTGDHPQHPFVIDAEGNLFVNLGSASNACQLKNRMTESKGHNPCTELETRGGVWRYDANKTNQKFSPKERYATGIRNAEGLAFDSAGRLFVTQHGRDQLYENWSKLYSPLQGQNQPAEALLQLKQGADYGWPKCYYDATQKKLVLAPEYGGDGGKLIGDCAKKQGPVAAYPAHWAPNALLYSGGTSLPEAYRNGFFIVFHGSWNRAPGPQGGYNVVYQPMNNGEAAGDYIVFADGFAGAVKDPDESAFRPAGIAIGPDGALYISDDKKGRIWRIIYKLSSLPIPPGATREDLEKGFRIYMGMTDYGTCAGCHGISAKGSKNGPDLTSGKWTWVDGSLSSIKNIIRKGVPKPKNFDNPMPPLGGSQLSVEDVDALAAYIWALGHSNKD